MSLLCWISLGAVPHCPWERPGASVAPACRKCLFILAIIIIIIIVIIAYASERSSPPCSLCSQKIKSVSKSTTKIFPLLPSRGTDPLPCGKLHGTHPVGHCQGTGIEEEACRAKPWIFPKESCMGSHSLEAAGLDGDKTALQLHVPSLIYSGVSRITGYILVKQH